MKMRKKVYFYEIVFTSEYYVDGINIFNDSNVEYLSDIDIDLKINVSFSKINNAKLLKIKDLNYEIVIAEVRDFKIVCFLKSNMFLKIFNHPRHKESIYKNHIILEDYVVTKIRNLFEDNIVYSPDYKMRAYINYEKGLVSLKYQMLNVDYDEGFYCYENVNSNNFWAWDDLPGISYFDTFENAKKEATSYLANYITETNRFFEEPDNILWEYETSKFYTWLYMMKFGVIGPIVIMLLSCLLPIFGQSNWNILWLSGGCSLFAIYIGSLVILTQYPPIMYRIADNSISTFKGIYRECAFDNIKKIKFKKNIFNKNKGSIKFILYKGMSVNFNFDNIENVEEVYKKLKDLLKL